jgi:hypothetical protein
MTIESNLYTMHKPDDILPGNSVAMILSSFSWRLLILSSTFSVMFFFAFHYAAVASQPIGGDAATHIAVAEHIASLFSDPYVSWHGIRETWYPVSAAILSMFRALPLSWTDRYIWWMSTGHVAAGAALAWLLYRLAGWSAAAWGMAIWALTQLDINTHFEDGTGAQLWSLVFLVLFLERTVARSIWGTAVAFLLTLASHPLSGLIATIVLINVVVALWVFPKESSKTFRAVMTSLVFFCLVGGVYILLFRSFTLLPDFDQGYSFDLVDLIRSPFGSLMITAVLGWFLLYSRHRSSALTWTLLTSLTLIIFLLAFQDRLGFVVWTNRFKTYFILLIIMCAGSALPTLFQSIFPHRLMYAGAVLTFLIPLYLMTWQNDVRIYKYYEDVHQQNTRALLKMQEP